MVLVEEEEEECKTMKTRVGHRLAHYHCRSGICALEGGARRELRAIRGKAWTFSCVGDNRKEEKKSWALYYVYPHDLARLPPTPPPNCCPNVKLLLLLSLIVVVVVLHLLYLKSYSQHLKLARRKKKLRRAQKLRTFFLKMGRSELGVVKPLFVIIYYLSFFFFFSRGGRDENDDICVVTESRERIGKHARLAGADVLLSGTAHHVISNLHHWKFSLFLFPPFPLVFLRQLKREKLSIRVRKVKKRSLIA